DCTAQYSVHFRKPAPEVPAWLASRAIEAASRWAARKCYLPCEYQMCGAITAREGGKITVYVTTGLDWHADVVSIGPEAEVVLDEGTLQPVGETTWHSPCATAQRECHAS